MSLRDRAIGAHERIAAAAEMRGERWRCKHACNASLFVEQRLHHVTAPDDWQRDPLDRERLVCAIEGLQFRWARAEDRQWRLHLVMEMDGGGVLQSAPVWGLASLGEALALALEQGWRTTVAGGAA